MKVVCEHPAASEPQTCLSVNDGVCDDGGPGAEYSDCAYGNDCAVISMDSHHTLPSHLLNGILIP